jgi:hypothetical protein
LNRPWRYCGVPLPKKRFRFLANGLERQRQIGRSSDQTALLPGNPVPPKFKALLLVLSEKVQFPRLGHTPGVTMLEETAIMNRRDPHEAGT